MEEYKKAQQKARDAWKRAKNGARVICRNCFKPVGAQGSQPAIKIGQDQYIHQSC